MKLGVQIGYWGMGLTAADQLQIARTAEDLGYDSIWSAEAYGSDAASVLAWLAAGTSRIKLGAGIFQIPARSAAMTAMTAATIDQISNGRMLLGLGTSGPQVSEGWHGVRFPHQVERTRDYVAVVRMALAPKNVALAGEIADGWLPVFFSPEHVSKLGVPLEEGAARAGRKLDDFRICPQVNVLISDDVASARDAMRPVLALYVGGMGSREQNFYNRLVSSYGFEDAAREVQDLYLSGQKAAAMEALPDELIDMTTIAGPRDRARERLRAFRDAGVETLIVSPMTFDPEERQQQLRLVAEVTDEIG